MNMYITKALFIKSDQNWENFLGMKGQLLIDEFTPNLTYFYYR